MFRETIRNGFLIKFFKTVKNVQIDPQSTEIDMAEIVKRPVSLRMLDLVMKEIDENVN